MANEEKAKTVNADLSKYVKTKAASGAVSVNNGDDVAVLLNGLNLDELYEIANTFCEPKEPFDYSKLNGGMQRMNLGNRIRGAVTKHGKQIDRDRAAAEKAEKNFKEPKAPLEVLQRLCAPAQKAAIARAKEAQKAADAKAKEAETKKKAAADAKAKAAKTKEKKAA